MTLDDLAPYQSSFTFTVRWTGHDNDSGLAAYNPYLVQVKKDNGSWQSWQTTGQTSHLYQSVDEATYSFRARATDQAGNNSAWSNELSIPHIPGSIRL